MDAVRILALVLVAVGALSLIYGGFTYTKDTQKAKVGPLELTVADTKTVSIPVWAGVATMVVGGALLLVRK